MIMTEKIKHSEKYEKINLDHLITIIMPVFNGESTIDGVLISLEKQNNKDLIKEIIFINDNSVDKSREVIEKYQERSSYRTRLIDNKNNEGLAKNYNKGIKACSSDYFILMHQDIILLENNCFDKIIAPFSDDNIVAVFPGLLHPFSVWKKYNFWQKCLFSRFVDKTILDLAGKFDCYNREKLIKHIGFFDEKLFRTAGEDGDMKRKIRKNGFKMIYSGFNVVHLHNREADFSYKKIFKKEAQLIESQGVLLRLYGIDNIKDFSMSFFRQILVILLFIPIVNFLDIFIISTYSFLYTKNVYIYERKNPRIFLLPIINIYLLFISTFFCLKGFIYGKQKI